MLFEHVYKPNDPVLYEVHQAVMKKTTYHGIPTYKFPQDAWVYQQMIHELRPDVIVEIGTKFGGSALMFADMMVLEDMVPYVVSVDIDHKRVHGSARSDSDIYLIEGDCTDPGVIERVHRFIDRYLPGNPNVLVIEDSAHTYDVTKACLEGYSDLVQPGGYFIVEDAMHCHAHNRGERGPLEAIHEWIGSHDNWEIDRSREQFIMTSIAQGYLRRKA